MADKIIDKLSEIIINIKSGADVAPGKNLKDDLDFDSLDTISLYFDIEKGFDIKIPEEDIEKHGLVTIANLIGYIEQKVQD